jgi:hypothetical protein
MAGVRSQESGTGGQEPATKGGKCKRLGLGSLSSSAGWAEQALIGWWRRNERMLFCWAARRRKLFAYQRLGDVS